MANAGLQMVALQMRAQPVAQHVGSRGLADAANIVALPLHRQQGGIADRATIDQLPTVAREADVQSPSLLIVGEVTAMALAGANQEHGTVRPVPHAVGDLA